MHGRQRLALFESERDALTLAADKRRAGSQKCDGYDSRRGARFEFDVSLGDRRRRPPKHRVTGRCETLLCCHQAWSWREAGGQTKGVGLVCSRPSHPAG